MKQTCKGFTLIELLIVIVVIGILSAMMMFSSTEAADSAKAAKIIADFTTLKKAINAWYLDNYDRIGIGVDTGNGKDELGILVNKKVTRFSVFVDGSGNAEFKRYIGNNSSLNFGSKNKNNTQDLYIIRATGKAKYWYISYYLGNKSSRLKEKLAGRAKSVGLLGSANLTADDEITSVYTNQAYVDMLLLRLD